MQIQQNPGRALKATAVLAAALLGAGLLGAAPGAAAPGPQSACTYQPTRLSGLPGSTGEGDVIGTDGDQRFTGYSRRSDVNEYPRAVVWDSNVIVADFGALAATYDVNRSGHVVGGNAGPASLLLRDGVKYTLVKPPQIVSAGVARAINDSGQIIGSGSTADGVYHGLAWSASDPATVRDLGPIGVGRGTFKSSTVGLRDISDSGQVVGQVEFGTRLRAVAGTAGNLNPLGGLDAGADSDATDVAGRFIVGRGTVLGQAPGMVLWQDGVASRLPGQGVATDVNASGAVSGYETVNGTDSAFVIKDGARTALPPLPGHDQARANVITEDGRVAGYSRGATGDPDRPVRSEPVVWSCG